MSVERPDAYVSCIMRRMWRKYGAYIDKTVTGLMDYLDGDGRRLEGMVWTTMINSSHPAQLSMWQYPTCNLRRPHCAGMVSGYRPPLQSP